MSDANLMSLQAFQREMAELNRWAQHGCSSHGCQIEPPRGMGTNASCSCRPQAFSDTLLWLAAEVERYGRHKRWVKPEDEQ